MNRYLGTEKVAPEGKEELEGLAAVLARLGLPGCGEPVHSIVAGGRKTEARVRVHVEHARDPVARGCVKHLRQK